MTSHEKGGGGSGCSGNPRGLWRLSPVVLIMAHACRADGRVAESEVVELKERCYPGVAPTRRMRLAKEDEADGVFFSKT